MIYLWEGPGHREASLLHYIHFLRGNFLRFEFCEDRNYSVYLFFRQTLGALLYKLRIKHNYSTKQLSSTCSYRSHAYQMNLHRERRTYVQQLHRFCFCQPQFFLFQHLINADDILWTTQSLVYVGVDVIGDCTVKVLDRRVANPSLCAVELLLV